MASVVAGDASGPAKAAAVAQAAHPAGDRPHVVVDNPVILIVAIMLAALLQILDTTIANVALPHMQSSLGATSETITWVLTSYIIASAIALPTTGWLAGRLGTRRLLLGSVSAFVILSMLCGMAVSLEEMVIFRVGQGVAGAFIVPLSQSVMLDVTRPSKHTQAMSIWGMGMMVGPIMGPILGGWLTENLEWRWVFFVNIPIGALSLFLLATQLSDWGREKVKFDRLGFILIGVTLASTQLLLDRGLQIDWFDSNEAWIYIGLILAFGWASVVHISTAKNPLFDRALFADRNFAVALLVMCIIGLNLYAILALLPPMLQHLFGYSVLETGLVLAPRGIGVLFSMPLSVYLARKGVRNRVLVGGGFLITAITMFEMSTWSLAVDSRHIVLTGLLQGAGTGMAFIPLNTLAFATLTPRLRASASSLLNLFRSIGSSIGISVAVSVLGRNIQVNHAELGQFVTATTLPAVDLSAVSEIQPFGGAAVTLINAEVNRQAAMIAYVNDFYMMGIFCVLAIPLVLLIRSAKSGDGKAQG